MKLRKAVNEWVFNLFTKRITVKIANMPNDARIEFLLNKLVNELVAQGHDIKGSGESCTEYFNVFGCNETIEITGHNCMLGYKRLTKV